MYILYIWAQVATFKGIAFIEAAMILQNEQQWPNQRLLLLLDGAESAADAQR